MYFFENQVLTGSWNEKTFTYVGHILNDNQLISNTVTHIDSTSRAHDQDL